MKLLIAELNGDKTHRKVLSDRLGYSSATESRDRSNMDGLVDDDYEEPDHVLKDEMLDYQEHQPDQVLEKPLENKEESKEKKEEGKEKNSVKFEVIAHDSNTEYKFLDNLTLDESNHLSEEELKSTVFNAFKTIEGLQNDLM